MKYKEIKLKGNKSVLVDESAEIKLGEIGYNSSDKRFDTCTISNKESIQEHWDKLIATINHSIDKDIPMVIVEDEIDAALEREFKCKKDLFHTKEWNWMRRSYKAAQENSDFSEKDIFGFLAFYNNYDIRKIGQYMHPTMDNTASIYNGKIDKQILKEYIQSLAKIILS